MPVRQLSVSPDVRQVKKQAKELLRAFRAGDQSALADFREFIGAEIDAKNSKLSDAQLVLALSYGATNFPQLIGACEFISACWSGKASRVREVVIAHGETLSGHFGSAHRVWSEDLRAAAMQGTKTLLGSTREWNTSDIDDIERQSRARAHLELVRKLHSLENPRYRKDLNGEIERRTVKPFVIEAKRPMFIDPKAVAAAAAERLEQQLPTEDEAEQRHLRFAEIAKKHAQDPTKTNRKFERMIAHNAEFRDSPQLPEDLRRSNDLMKECLRLYRESHYPR